MGNRKDYILIACENETSHYACKRRNLYKHKNDFVIIHSNYNEPLKDFGDGKYGNETSLELWEIENIYKQMDRKFKPLT